MVKHLANIVSGSRIIGSAALFMLNDFSGLFIAIYCFCGFTDLIDGPIARKTNSSSALGAALDTIGDVLTYLALVKVLFIQSLIPGWALAWLFTNMIIGTGIAVISQIRFKKFYIPHTYLGKSLGASIFFLPIMSKIMPIEYWLIFILGSMSVNILECFYIQLKSKKAYDFAPSAFHLKKLEAKSAETAESK